MADLPVAVRQLTRLTSHAERAQADDRPPGMAPMARTQPRRPSPRHLRSVFLWTLLGVLLTQAAWCLVLAPFGGTDEHDHAFKAAATARGDWSNDHLASVHGWGEEVVVPRDLVSAAAPVCRSLSYTTVDNCGPGVDVGEGQVRVASSAARYNPAFYAVIGTAARPFEGVTSLYAMRIAGAVLCALLLAAAATATAVWARTRWPAVGLLLAVTPMVLYSTVVAAPNGLELCAAALTWSALLGLVRVGAADVHTRLLVGLVVLGALPLTTVRSMGPLWLLVITGCVALLATRAELVALIRLRAVRAAAAVVVIATLAAVAWTLTAGTNSIGAGSSGEQASATARLEPMWQVLPRVILEWFLQSVAAFPFRNQPAPMLVYVVAFVVMVPLALFAADRGGRRERIAMVAILGLGTLIPVAMTFTTYRTAGNVIWQGRYSLPFTMGLFLVAGFALDRAAPQWRRWAGPALVTAAVAVLVEEVFSVTHVWSLELDLIPRAGTAGWATLPQPVVVTILVLGALAGLRGLAHVSRDPMDTVDTAATADPAAR